MTIRTLKHSTGIVFTTREQVGDEASFHVDVDGVTELAGWGHAGPVPQLYVNPPADPLALHVVTVEDGASADEDDEPDQVVLVAIADLVAEHLARYAECRSWCVDLPRALTNWITAGCQVPADVEEEGEPAALTEPSLDELRAEYEALTGTAPDGRWKEGRLAEELKAAKVQAAKDRAAAARAGAGAAGSAGEPSGTESAGDGS